MEMISDLMEFIFIFAILGGMAFLVAQMSKERNVGFWTLFVLSVFLTPFAGILVGLLAGKRKNPNEPPTNIKEAQGKFWERFMPNSDGKENQNRKNPPPPPHDYDDGMQPKGTPSKEGGNKVSA